VARAVGSLRDPADRAPAARRHEVLEVDEESWHRDRERRAREVTGWVVLTHPWLEWLWSGSITMMSTTNTHGFRTGI